MPRSAGALAGWSRSTSLRVSRFRFCGFGAGGDVTGLSIAASPVPPMPMAASPPHRPVPPWRVAAVDLLRMNHVLQTTSRSDYFSTLLGSESFAGSGAPRMGGAND